MTNTGELGDRVHVDYKYGKQASVVGVLDRYIESHDEPGYWLVTDNGDEHEVLFQDLFRGDAEMRVLKETKVSDPNFTFGPFTVYDVYETTKSGAKMIGTTQQLDPTAPGPERWAIKPWCGKKDNGRYASRWVAAERLLQIHKEHFASMYAKPKEPSVDEPLPPVYDLAVGRVKLRDGRMSPVRVFIVITEPSLRLYPIEQGIGGPGLPLEGVELSLSPHNAIRYVTGKLRDLQSEGKL